MLSLQTNIESNDFRFCAKLNLATTLLLRCCYISVLVLTCFRLTKGRYFFSTRNNCCEFLASYGAILQSDIQPYFKTPVCGATFSYCTAHYFGAMNFHLKILIFLNLLKRIAIKLNTNLAVIETI